ncbi:MAG: hypothetical protein Tsb002_06510 [Wenzhouxiangellaceae bacterium]
MAAQPESVIADPAGEGVKLAFALWTGDDSAESEAEGPSLRDISLSWLRFGYQGEVFAASSLTEVIRQASAAGYNACFVQRPGHIITEDWLLPHWQQDDVYQLLRHWVADNDFLVAVQPDHSSCKPLESTGLLVQLDRYRDLGQPQLEQWLATNAIGAADNDNAALIELPIAIQQKMTRIEQRDQCTALDSASDSASSTTKQRFLHGLNSQLQRGRQGVFLWNIESYDDVPEAPPAGQGPLHHLYCVAAGFKPNCLLHRYGYQPDTRVTFFDYSQQALAIRRYLIEHWDGSDYPDFCRELMQRFTTDQTFYQLWNGIKPEQIDWRDATALWQRELSRWGGAAAFKRIWQQQQQLQYQYVHCDVVADPSPLLHQVEAQGASVIWWSNAFFTISSNWLLSIEQRRQRYWRWIEGLSQRAPQCLLYGADHLNSAVNNLSARQYLQRLQASAATADQDELKPVQHSPRALRF